MFLQSIQISNYKNLDLNFTPSSGLNLLIADNGRGKTNLLEAINYLAINKSFRNNEEVFPDNKIAEYVSIAAGATKDNSSNNLRLVWTADYHKHYYFNQKLTNFAKVRKNIKTLLYAPTSINLVTDGASVRRDFLDTALISLLPNLKTIISTYYKVIRQKNALLTNSQANDINSQLTYWNQQIVSLATTITVERILLVQLLIPLMNDIGAQIFNLTNYNITFNISSKFVDSSQLSLPRNKLQELITSNLKEKLQLNRSKEIETKRVLYGSHKDDYEFMIANRTVRYYASRGQQRLFSLVLHLALLELIESEYEDSYIILLDDIFAELDKSHRMNTCRYLLKKQETKQHQFFITSANEEDFTSEFKAKTHLLQLD